MTQPPSWREKDHGIWLFLRASKTNGTSGMRLPAT
jgi:hypothetical protein